ISKSWAVTAQGHPREAQVLGAGGLELARRHGLVGTELRGRMNLSNWYVADDPRRAMEVAGAGVELARRVGHGEWAAALAANVGLAALAAGEWDGILRSEEELYNEHLADYPRQGLVAPATGVRAFRGVDGAPFPETELGRSMLASGSAQDRVMVTFTDSLVRYARGDLVGAAASARRSLQEMSESTESLAAVINASNGLVELRDAEALAEMLDILDGLGHSAGEWLDASLVQLRAALAWLRGDAVTGERGYRDAIQTWRRLDLSFSLLVAELGMLVLGGAGLRGRDALAQEALSIAERLGAVTLIERLERATAQTPYEASTTSRSAHALMDEPARSAGRR
ncbi:MAG: hypothetical protein M3472_06850, partial [Chloroflexota bacterium]|nr:hypothetical protein [Chloroflexota bacterium]